jgi:hypothetical protein
MAPERRARRGIIKCILTTLATGLGAAGGLAEAWVDLGTSHKDLLLGSNNK